MQVALLARTQEQLEGVAADCRGLGVKALAIKCDVTSGDSVEAAVGRTMRELGAIDLLLNNAGVGTYKRILELSETEWDVMYGVNVKGVFLMLKAVLPHMVARRDGHVITISSTRGLETIPETVGYSATKFALMGMHSALSQDMRQHGVRVSVICPGGVRTGFGGIPAEKKDASWLSPEQVADAVVCAARMHHPATISQLTVI
jgi:3-oxoacyl-[acyl-carrier protein] reductase